MDDLAFIRERIPAYADYPDEDARHLVDKQVRAWVGEALSRLRQRLGAVGPALSDRFERVLLLCEFTNQQFVRGMDHVHLSAGDLEHLHVVDRELIEAADRAAEVDQSSIEGFLGELEQLFARRAKAVAPAPA
ncbi:MAG: hypothetical protein JO101_11995 [Candidatus Eremiobacteraeota bacterium]|nr:hypothetical protein [Candidatus Eremiobacteraeota bacterium]MBV8356037.1 hypothetical protein [Candidatus Eremiobacteraeota bacterium]